MITTYLLYFTLMAASVLFTRLAVRKNTKIWLVAAVALLSVVAGLRAFSVGWDTNTYVVISIRPVFEGNIASAYGEEGFKGLILICSLIWKNETLVLLVMSALTHFFILFRFWDFKDKVALEWVTFCYFAQFYFMSLNLMRQFLAVALVFYATRYLREQRYEVFCFATVIAALFHTTAVLGFAFLFLELLMLKYRPNPKKAVYWGLGLIVGASVAVLGGMLVAPAFAKKLLQKLTEHFQNFKLDIGFMLPAKALFVVVAVAIVYAIPFSFGSVKELLVKERAVSRAELSCLVHRTAIGYFDGIADRRSGNAEIGTLITRAEKRYEELTLYLYYAVAIVLTALGYLFVHGERFGLYFYLFEAVCMGWFLRKAKNEYLTWAVFLLFFYIMLYAMMGNGQGQMPYLFFWQTA